MEWIKFTGVVLLCFGAFSVGYLRQGIEVVHATPSEYQFIEYLNTRFAKAHNYTDDYKCLNYSNDYNVLMQLLGYNVSLVTGHNYTHGHAWNKLVLEIEPITGKLRDNSNTYHIPYDKK